MKEHADKLSRRRQGAARSGDRQDPRSRPRATTPRRSSRPIDELEQASHALSKTLYERRARRPAGTGTAAGADGGAKPGGDEEAIDAEFEVKE